MSDEIAASLRPSERYASNAAYPWDQFDSEAYFQHYYGDPHPDDDRVIRCAIAALKRFHPQGTESLDIIDVGTGPNLIPFFCTLPWARSLTAWEYSASNVAWLNTELQQRHLRPQWLHFWATALQSYGPAFQLPANPMAELRAKSKVTRGSIFDLPRHRWDAATMFFCAESITSDAREFEAACAAFAGCVKPDGILAAAFLVRSGGYEVAGQAFPVLSVSAEGIEKVFRRHAHDVKVEQIGIVEREIRSGYAGFTFLTGRSL